MSYQLLAIIAVFSISFLILNLFILYGFLSEIRFLKQDNKEIKDLYYNEKDFHAKTLEKIKKERPKSIELQEFLNDLLHGEALISVHRVDSANLFMYSPREK